MSGIGRLGLFLPPPSYTTRLPTDILATPAIGFEGRAQGMWLSSNDPFIIRPTIHEVLMWANTIRGITGLLMRDVRMNERGPSSVWKRDDLGTWRRDEFATARVRQHAAIRHQTETNASA